MTAHELRKHLAAMHAVVMWGASFGLLVARHDADHLTGLVAHTHDHDHEGDSGHLGDLEHALWVVLLLVFILVGLRMLGLV